MAPRKTEKPDAEWRGQIRLPADVYAEVLKLAEEDDRSFTREVAVLLREALLARRGP